MESLKVKFDIQEQYSPRNCLLIHGISENKHKDTDELVWKTLKSDMNNNLKIEHFDQTHRTESFKKGGCNRKSIPAIVKFVQYADRSNFFF